MRIIAIEDFTSSRKKVILDDDTVLVLYKGEIRKQHLDVGTEISDDEIIVLSEIIAKRAKLRCLKLLEQKDYTHKQLRDKLLRDGYTNEVIDKAINYIDDYGYINDANYAIGYAEAKLRRKSRREVKMLLEQRGITTQEIMEAFDFLEREGRIPQEEDVIRTILSKRHYSTEDSFEEQQKTRNYLMQKGFDLSAIRSGMNGFQS